MNESPPQRGDVSRKADCAACKLIGAGGCFAGAWYALFERARLPPNNRNRRWLGAIAVGESCSWVMVVIEHASILPSFSPVQLQ